MPGAIESAIANFGANGGKSIRSELITIDVVSKPGRQQSPQPKQLIAGVIRHRRWAPGGPRLKCTFIDAGLMAPPIVGEAPEMQEYGFNRVLAAAV